MEKRSALKHFVERTGLEPEIAATILSEVNWDIGKGIQRFDDYVRLGRIKPQYPPPQFSATWSPHHRPSDAAISGNRSYDKSLPRELETEKNYTSQWTDIYGEVRRPATERIIPIQHITDRGDIVNTFPTRFVSNTQDYNHSAYKTMPKQPNKPTVTQQINVPSTPQQINKSSVTQQYSDPAKHVNRPSVIQHFNSPVTQHMNKPSMTSQVNSQSVPLHTNKPTVIQTQSASNISKENPNKAVNDKPAGSSAVLQSKTESQNSPLTQSSTKSLQEKSAAVPSPVSSPRPLKRGFSKIVENESLVTMTRKGLLNDIEEDSHDHMYIQTFVLPDLTVFSADYRAFLEKDLIETSTLVSLEQAGRLNWWAEVGICQRLLPMATTGDGNCLLHAASLAMWGIHDRQLMLRKELYETLTTKPYKNALYRRWRWQQTQQNKEAGLIFTEDEWQAEWNGVLKLASTSPRHLPGVRRHSSCCDSLVTHSHDDENSPVIYESLEEFHVFVLSHILQRVIIVVADTILKDSMGEALAPIPFGGIYLPLEIDPKSCYKSPLLLTYDAAHFSALVPMASEVSQKDGKLLGLPVAMPLVDPALNLLPVHFCVDPGASYDWSANNPNMISTSKVEYSHEDKLNLMKMYLQIEHLPATLLEYDSDSDKKSSGSYESDDNSKRKDKKTSHDVNTVTKQFGSLGKSINKKIKKNFGSVGKALKSMGPDQKISRKPSVGSGLTQSTRVPMTIATMAEQDQALVLCAKLSTKQSEMHQEMVKNYMLDARHRFQRDRQMMQARGEEIRRRSMEIERHPECISPGCHMFGSPETHYLCYKCYNEQKQEAVYQEKCKSMHPSSNTDKVESYGKSKFYLASEDEDLFPESDSVVKPSRDTVQGPSLSVNLPMEKPQAVKQRPQSYSHSFKPASSTDSRPVSHPPRPRTPSPDYDNVDYTSYRLQPKLLISQPHPTSPKLDGKLPKSEFVSQLDAPSSGNACRTPGCFFYGCPEQNYLCSACFKREKQRHDQPLTRV